MHKNWSCILHLEKWTALNVCKTFQRFLCMVRGGTEYELTMDKDLYFASFINSAKKKTNLSYSTNFLTYTSYFQSTQYMMLEVPVCF